MSQNRRGQKEKGQTLFFALRSLKEAWTKVKRIGKITPERKTRMQPNWGIMMIKLIIRIMMIVIIIRDYEKTRMQPKVGTECLIFVGGFQRG